MPEIYLWLDDERKAPTHADSGVVWTCAKTYEQAIEILKTGDVVFASLDHDLADEHYQKLFGLKEGEEFNTADCKEKTGYDVLCWMEENNVWPQDGVRIHTANWVRGPIMQSIVRNHYGRNFQYVFG